MQNRVTFTESEKKMIKKGTYDDNLGFYLK